jgi:ferritin-like metal-binding protein YciE
LRKGKNACDSLGIAGALWV